MDGNDDLHLLFMQVIIWSRLQLIANHLKAESGCFGYRKTWVTHLSFFFWLASNYLVFTAWNFSVGFFLGVPVPLGMAKVFQQFHKGGHWVSFPGTNQAPSSSVSQSRPCEFFLPRRLQHFGVDFFKGGDGNWNDQPMVYYVNWWFGAHWFGFRLDPRKWKRLGFYVKLRGRCSLIFGTNRFHHVDSIPTIQLGSITQSSWLPKQKTSINFKLSMPLWPKKVFERKSSQKIKLKMELIQRTKIVVATFLPPQEKRSFSRTELEVSEVISVAAKNPMWEIHQKFHPREKTKIHPKTQGRIRIDLLFVPLISWVPASCFLVLLIFFWLRKMVGFLQDLGVFSMGPKWWGFTYLFVKAKNVASKVWLLALRSRNLHYELV